MNSLAYAPYLDTDSAPVQQLGVVDYDGTLVSVRESFSAVLDVAQAHGIEPEELHAARASAKESGDSFYALRHIEKRWGAERARAIYIALGNGGIRSRYYADAERFIGRLNASGFPHFVMTRTGDLAGQFAKIISSPYDGGIMMVPDDDKGKYANTFRYPDGHRFHRVGRPLGSYSVAAEVCLIDNNSATFKNWQGPGYYLLRGNELNGDLPSNIVPIQTLDELDVVGGRIVKAGHRRPPRAVSRVAVAAMSVLPVLNPKNPYTKNVWIGEAA
jgi:hypothetical protein